MTISFGQAHEAYANRGTFRSAHTQGAYLRGVALFMDYLADRNFKPQIPLQSLKTSSPIEIPVEKLTTGDESLLLNFAAWLQTPGEGDKRPYKRATVELRLAGVQRWFEFMNDQNWLPGEFSLAAANNLLKKNAKSVEKVAPDKTVEVAHDLSGLLTFFETQKPPSHLVKKPERLERWELTRLRNHALIRTLAETGGQITAILSINAGTVDNSARNLKIEVAGKNEHTYHIYLEESLPAIRDYLKRRAIPKKKRDDTPLFVSHDARYDGNRMSRIIAWRIIQRAAKGVGLPKVSPHDFRHWCAQQWIASGLSLAEVQVRLGHRSIHTVRTYYGHMVEEEEGG